MKKNSLKTAVFDLSGKKLEEIELPREIFAVEINKKLLTQAVKVYLANQRQGTASTKTRGEVRGSGKKIYRQKGTGRARHGDRYAPIFVGGGVAFGPKPKDYSLKLSKKMRKKALLSALSAKFADGEIIIVSGMEKLKEKTKKLFSTLENLKIKTKRGGLEEKVLLAIEENLENLYLAGRNIKRLTIFPASLLNSYAILNSQKIILTKKSIDVLLSTFLKKQK